MNQNPDLILVHPPSVYDFRRRDDLIFPHIFNTAVKVSPMLEMFPLGFYNIKSYLEVHHINVEICNLAKIMLDHWELDVKDLLMKLKPRIFGIGFHWLAHANGALEICKVIKDVHKDVPILLGGNSASYFYKELIKYPFVDFIIRGNIPFQPLELLIKHLIEKDSEYSKIPNLCYKKNGKVYINPDKFYSEKSFFPVNWGIKELKDKNINFVTIIPTLGCNRNCCFCSASRYSTKRYALQNKVFLCRPGKKILTELNSFKVFWKSPLKKRKLDLSIPGYWHEDRKLRSIVLNKIKKLGLFSVLHIETFELMPMKIIKDITKYVNPIIEISPESHDFKIRKLCQRAVYTNREFEGWAEKVLELNVKRLEVYFMIGLPGQTAESINDTVKYCEFLLGKFKRKKNLIPFINAMIPFLNPASAAFEHPQKYGYRLFYKTAREHANALTEISLKNRLNYETKWLSREQILNVTYRFGRRLTLAKMRHGYLSSGLGKAIISRLDETFQLKGALDKIDLIKDSKRRSGALQNIAKRIRIYNKEIMTGKFCDQLPIDLSLYNFWYEI